MTGLLLGKPKLGKNLLRLKPVLTVWLVEMEPAALIVLMG
jgi:hypothetical protein